MEHLTIREALKRASSFLSARGFPNPELEAEVLLRFVLKWDRTRFILSLGELHPSVPWQEVEQLLTRRANGEPLQYITGEQEFYGEIFKVGPEVLIPRPETELLVEQVLKEGDLIWGEGTRLHILDLGTGSGAIPITLARERPAWDVWTLDLSAGALRLAKENAVALGVADRIHFLQGDMLQLHRHIEAGELRDGYHILVSNPPYIPTGDISGLQVEVREHEPHMALDGGPDGLHFYRGIAAQLERILITGGFVALEVGWQQARIVSRMLEQANAKETRILADFQGIERIVLGYF
jgi:release factor glutamine methyltransferase